MLQERLDAALKYLDDHKDTICVLSGGKGSDESISEAECMYRYMTERGIDPTKLIREDKSTTTRENLLFSMELLAGRWRNRGSGPDRFTRIASAKRTGNTGCSGTFTAT